MAAVAAAYRTVRTGYQSVLYSYRLAVLQQNFAGY